jgi:hypothetical protein
VEPGKVRFAKEKETSLITLYARALESRYPDPVLGAVRGERLAPAFQLLERVRLPQLARRFGMPRPLRALLRLTSLVPSLRGMTCLLYRFPRR